MSQSFDKHVAAVSLESECRSLVLSAVAVIGDKVSLTPTGAQKHGFSGADI